MAIAARPLSGPRLPPLRGAATHLVVLCHGYGADGNDLIGLAPHWQRLLPTVAFVAPNAPEPCAAGPGYQWFPISRLDPEAMRGGVEAAAVSLDAFLDAELARLSVAAGRLALVGFSQGTMMSLQVGLARAVKPACIVGYSGMLAGSPTLGADAPPILLIHGEADPMIPVQSMLTAAAALGRAGAAVQWHISPGIGHSIDQVGLELGGMFLAMSLRGLLARREAQVSCALSE